MSLTARARRLVDTLRTSKFVRDTLTLQIGKLGTAGLSALSTLIALRVLGPAEFGRFGLAESLVALWQAFDLTGIGISTLTRLGVAVGKRDEQAVIDAMAVYVRISTTVSLVILAGLWLLGQIVAGQIHNGQRDLGVIAALLAFNLLPDGYYLLVVTALQTRRQMRALALLQLSNQAVLTVCVLTAIALQPRAESLAVARIVYSMVTVVIAMLAYHRLRLEGEMPFPALSVVMSRARSIAVRPYLGFGFLNAVDRNLASLFVQVPIQMVGAVSGNTVTGYLRAGLDAMSYLSLFTSAVFDNMAAVVPQLIGRRDFARLRTNFARVLLVMALGSVVVYGSIALLAPIVIPLLIGDEWIPTIPTLQLLTIMGFITTVGGLFGPLYRALGAMRGAITAKIIAIVTGLPIGWLLISGQMSLSGLPTSEMSATVPIAAGALGGAWAINLLYALSVAITAWFTLRALQRTRETHE